MKSLKEINWTHLINKKFTPSPSHWEDQFMYFLLVDRFSNNKEAGYVTGGSVAAYQLSDYNNAVASETEAAVWRSAATTWQGGKIAGIINKLDYLAGLGISVLWISPVYKQVSFQETYHGYGIQNFLEVDKNFGSKEDFKTLVETAHSKGIYVVLDIVLNHVGNVFTYKESNESSQWTKYPKWSGKKYTVQGFNNAFGNASISFNSGSTVWENDGIWPVEFQEPANYTCQGQIRADKGGWDNYPEYKCGDFYDYKDVNTGSGDTDYYQPSAALVFLTEAYKYWIAFADIDGFRIDTIKHLDDGATRFFVNTIKEFAQRIGKDNFYLIGEDTSDRKTAVERMNVTGLDAILGISDVQEKLQSMVKGKSNPNTYFDLFRNSSELHKETHAWFKNKVITMIDDHDKVCQGENKSRFCAFDSGDLFIFNAIALNLTTLGIPCLYYGSEQYFNGHGNSDKYLREAMFGGSFGAFGSKGKHFFNTNHTLYKQISAIAKLRQQKLTLKRGRQYLREISNDGIHFGLPTDFGSGKLLSVIAWSRIMDTEEIILAINTDKANTRTTWIIIDNSLHSAGEGFQCTFSTVANTLNTPVLVRQIPFGKIIQITVPPAGFVMFEKVTS